MSIPGIILERLRQKKRTFDFPAKAPLLPERYLGRPLLRPQNCDACGACRKVCPTGAIKASAKALSLDLGACIFCGQCQKLCPSGAIEFTREIGLASRSREGLILRGQAWNEAAPLEPARRKLFSRSLKLRQVSAGGCGACEADLNVLGTLVFDLPRFGVDFVASPRHADGVVITGPVSTNMREALLSTFEAVPDPKVVIAVGSCAISGGPFAGFEEVWAARPGLPPVDLFIPGCPPHPWSILHAFLRLLGKI